MAKFVPVFLAFILNFFSVNIFTENAPGSEPLVSCLIFLFALFILLWDTKLYPKSLRKQPKFANCFLEFILADFIMEYVMKLFWLPLEARLAILLPKIAEYERDLLKQSGTTSGGVFSFLAWDGMLITFSYILSGYFLFIILHGTRAVDFTLLSVGFGVFFKDVMCRLKKLRRKLCKYFRSKRFNSKGASKSRKSIKSTISSDLDICDDNSETYISKERLSSFHMPRQSYYN